MSNQKKLSSSKLRAMQATLTKYCQSKFDMEKYETDQLIRTCKVSYAILFLHTFYKQFIHPFFINRTLTTERTIYNKVRQYFVSMEHDALEFLQSSDKFYAKPFFDNYCSWCDRAGVLENSIQSQIKKGIDIEFMEFYARLFPEDNSDKREYFVKYDYNYIKPTSRKGHSDAQSIQICRLEKTCNQYS